MFAYDENKGNNPRLATVLSDNDETITLTMRLFFNIK